MRNPNGYGSVVKLSGNRRKPYCVRKAVTQWNEKGYPVYEVIGYFPNRKEALQALADYNSDPYDLSGKDITFGEVYQLWAEKHYPTLTDLVVRQYKQVVPHFSQIFDLPFAKLKVANLQQALDESTLSPSGQRKMKNIINGMYRYALKSEIVKRDLSQYVTAPQIVPKKERSIFTEEEIQKLWNSLDVEGVDDVLIMLYSGWRASEYCELQTANIDLKGNTMRGGMKTEAGRNRVVPIHHLIKPLIEAKFSSDKKYLIGIKYRTLHDRFTKTMTALNMSHTLHETRHTFISRLDNADANQTAIKRLVGHSSCDVTSRVYTHKDIEQLRKAIELLT